MKYTAFITFKHLPHWQKQQLVEAKSAKKAEDLIRRMYKDDILEVMIEETKRRISYDSVLCNSLFICGHIEFLLA